MEEHDETSHEYADLSRRLSDVERSTQRVEYAVFGLSDHNGLMGTTANLAIAIDNLNKSLSAKIEALSTRSEDRSTALLWKVIAALGALVLLLFGALVTVATGG